MTTYSTGTISVGAGSTTVTGVGTSWLTAGVRAGDRLVANGLVGIIASVNTATSITLKRAWAGAAISGGNYDIEYVDDGVRALASASALLQALGAGTLTSLGALTGAANRMPYWSGAGVMAATDLTAEARQLLGSALLGRSGDNLVTAATARITGGAVTQSSSDTTAGRLTKVGDFGIGATGAAGVSLNSAVVQGIYSYLAGDAANPTPGNGGAVIVQALGGTFIIQITSQGNGYAQFLRWSGDGGTTWAAWSRIYSARSIIGTVSQASGVPTGAIIERGSNANGEYVRFADGTQICWNHSFGSLTPNTADGSLYVSADGAWTFPAAFVNDQIVVSGTARVTARFITAGTASTTSVPIRAYAATSQVTAGAVRVMAIGRWF